jgi:hypothetical protein
MAVTINVTSADTINPGELLEWALENIDPTDDESMVLASERLAALSNNRDFVIEKIREQMLLLASGKDDHISSTQATIHASGTGKKGSFVVRSIIWTPPLTTNSRSKEAQDKILSFVTPHDHNFGLLTIGYYGPGYETVIHEYDHDSIVGESDEKVSIKYLETTTLSKGKIIYFRPSRDIHSQFHPSDLSISVNLIGQSFKAPSIPQYEFDVEKQKIKHLLPASSVIDLLCPFKIIGSLGADSNMIDVISSLSRRHVSHYVRAEAYKTLAKLWPEDFEKLVVPGIDDRHQFVKNTVTALYSKMVD